MNDKVKGKFWWKAGYVHCLLVTMGESSNYTVEKSGNTLTSRSKLIINDGDSTWYCKENAILPILSSSILVWPRMYNLNVTRKQLINKMRNVLFKSWERLFKKCQYHKRQGKERLWKFPSLKEAKNTCKWIQTGLDLVIVGGGAIKHFLHY